MKDWVLLSGIIMIIIWVILLITYAIMQKNIPENSTKEKSTINNTVLPKKPSTRITPAPTITKEQQQMNTTIPAKVTHEEQSMVPHWVYQQENVTSCYHGIIINDSYGNSFCTRAKGGEELKNFSSYWENETAYNRSHGLPNYQNISTPSSYLYYKENCTNVTLPYTWNGIDFIVNSSHELSCEQIKKWTNNAAIMEAYVE